MIRAIIVDDEPLAIKLLENYAAKLDQIKILGAYTNPITALNFIQSTPVDLIFLDIHMSELSGLNLAKLIGEDTKIIFTTAYPDHAVQGFELKALDYLVKPINLARFLDAVSRYEQVAPTTVEKNTAKYLFVKTEYRKQRIDFADIYFLQGMGDYCAIVTKDKKIMTLEKLRSFEGRLPSSNFIRVHKSYIVAVDKIDFVEKNKIKILENRVPIGATYEARVKEVLEI